MAVYFDSFLTELIVTISFLVFLILLYFQYAFSYWNRKKIITPEPSFPFGNFKDIILRKETFGVSMANIYKDLKRKGVKYGGCYMFAKPLFMPIDPEIVKQIFIKDFTSFQDRGLFADEEKDPLSAHLFTIGGAKWKLLRAKLSPTFTSGKIKSMFHTLVECGDILEETLEDIIKSKKSVDIKDIAARFTTDIISSCAFGLECSSLKNPDDEFRKHGKMVFETDFVEGIKGLLQFTFPKIFNYIPLKIVKPKVSKFFLNVINQTVTYREKNNIERKDMLDLLLKLKNDQSVDDKVDKKMTNGNDQHLTMNELAAQCFVFFIGGFETSSTVMTFCLFELAQHQDIQDKLREEIRTVLKNHNGKLTYDAMNEMTYMDKVINETMRKYPPVPFLNREANENWIIPGTNTIIEKGTGVFISSFGMHYDPEYYPNPEKFDPERFSEEVKNKRPAFTYLPFGDGPRNCIGMRFGVLQTKVGLTIFLKNTRFSLEEKTMGPVVFDINSVVLTHEHSLLLKTEKI